MPRPRHLRFLPTALAAALLAGCQGERSDEPHPQHEVVVYTSVDEEFSKPVLTEYRNETGIDLRPIFDTESTKAFGLAGRLIAEAGSPGCDLFWNNEILNTLRLKQKGLLEPFHPKNADDYPPQFKAADGTWYGFAARARILIVNTEVVQESERPTSIHDLTDPKWKGKIAIAKPLFGTTGTHAACLFARWGEKPAREFFLKLKANDAQILQGNKQVAMAVGAGHLAFGMTDTDDAMGEIAAGSPATIVYPDREPDQLGTLFIPNTLARIKGAPHPEEAEKLASYLLSPEVESRLAESTASQIPLNRKTPVSARIETPRTVHAMDADFEKAAKIWDTQVAPFLAKEFASAE
jgi:iron(III) transport system substrate-binding protein